jgi:hypothetical protein
VLNQHLKCFGKSDFDGVLADYSSNAVLFMPGRPLKGPDAIKSFFQALLSEYAKPGASFSMREQCVIPVKLNEEVLTPTQKKEIVSKPTDAMVSIEAESMLPAAW